MSTTQPIRDKQELKHFMDYYKTEHPNPRNYALMTVGLHTALRISDILSLKWGMVYDFEREKMQEHIVVCEKKTGKQNVIAMNGHVAEALLDYAATRKIHKGDYIFSKSTTPGTPLCRSQAFRIVRTAAEQSMDQKHISCHSLRKTFGYHAWKSGIQPALLMDIYNHSSYAVTKKYLGINQDERDEIFLEMEF